MKLKSDSMVKITQKGGAKGDEVQKAVEAAIDAGYRLIDSAQLYQTEDQVGQAIKNKIADGTIKREDIFVITKVIRKF